MLFWDWFQYSEVQVPLHHLVDPEPQFKCWDQFGYFPATSQFYMNVQGTLTTDRDLHYCGETQLAASKLVCSTHNSQLLTFS